MIGSKAKKSRKSEREGHPFEIRTELSVFTRCSLGYQSTPDRVIDTVPDTGYHKHGTCLTGRDTDNVGKENLKEGGNICKVKHITCFGDSIACCFLDAYFIRMLIYRLFLFYFFFSHCNSPFLFL